MSVWVLHQELTPQEEEKILERKYLALPFEGLPDLSFINSKEECAQLVRALFSNEPPETIALKADRVWGQLSEIQMEDTITVPLPASDAVAIARVCERYHYKVDEAGGDRHLIPVEWLSDPIKLKRFGNTRSVFNKGNSRFYQVTSRPDRIAILNTLPHKYNRFVKLKWLIVIFMALGAVKLYVMITRGY
jgi:predicted Mrr-cat superfamily restriction endonuclease